jgi:hypothetical protein
MALGSDYNICTTKALADAVFIYRMFLSSIKEFLTILHLLVDPFWPWRRLMVSSSCQHLLIAILYNHHHTTYRTASTISQRPPHISTLVLLRLHRQPSSNNFTQPHNQLQCLPAHRPTHLSNDALLLLLQDPNRLPHNGRTEKRHLHPGNPQIRRPVPQHQARRHHRSR